MTLRELKESISHLDESYDELEVVIPNNKRSIGPIGTTKVTGLYQGIDWNSGYLIMCPEVKMEEAETIVGNDGFEFDNSSTMPPNTNDDELINYLRRETGMSKQSIHKTLYELRKSISNLCRDWYRAHGKKTSDSGLCDAKSIYGERELTVDERMHIWFVDTKPNRDVCDSVDELSDEEKHKYFDKCNITRTIQVDIPSIIKK